MTRPLSSWNVQWKNGNPLILWNQCHCVSPARAYSNCLGWPAMVERALLRWRCIIRKPLVLVIEFVDCWNTDCPFTNNRDIVEHVPFGTNIDCSDGTMFPYFGSYFVFGPRMVFPFGRGRWGWGRGSVAIGEEGEGLGVAFWRWWMTGSLVIYVEPTYNVDKTLGRGVYMGNIILSSQRTCLDSLTIAVETW